MIFVPNTDPKGNHLHLDKGYHTAINPLAEVVYTLDNQQPGLQKRIGRDASGNFSEITGNILYGKTILEARTDTYASHEKDLDEVDFFITPENGTETRLWQVKFTGDAVNSDTGNIEVLGHGSFTDSENLIRQAVNEKCYPVYISEEECGLDYFKYHFYTHQRKGTNRADGINAVVNDINDSAGPVYPDGRYDLRINAKDIRGVETSETASVIVDNFAPYVKKLEVFQNGQRIYNASWDNESGELKLSPEGGERQTGDIKAGELITIRAEFSRLQDICSLLT